MDQPGRYFYLRDQDSGDFLEFLMAAGRQAAEPLQEHVPPWHGLYSHQFALCRRRNGIDLFVPLGQLFEYWRLKVTNKTKRERKLSVFTYCEFASSWNMPNDLSNLQYSQFVIKADMVDGILGMSFAPVLQVRPVAPRSMRPDLDDPVRRPGRGATKRCGRISSAIFTGRMPILGPWLRENARISWRRVRTVAAPSRPTSCWRRAKAANSSCCWAWARRSLMDRPRSRSSATRNVVPAEFEALKRHWHGLLEAVKVKTPDPDFDHMANVWGAYNALITYAWSRHASMIYNGERDGLGFRDTVQDFLV